jgi:methionyl-tRNA formyltransferase
VIFMGTPGFAVPSLRAVAECCDVAVVVTRPDRPRGRGRVMSPSEIAAEAGRLGLPVVKPESLDAPESRGALSALKADLFAVVAFGAILSPALLAMPRLGALNLHGSLLPEYRGASPVQRALWDGRTETGVTTMWIDEGLDTGDVALQRRVAIEPSDDAGALAARLADVGGPLLAETLLLAHEGRAPRQPQDPAAGSYARKLGKKDGVVDFALDAETVWHRQRAVTPWPGATTAFRGRQLLLRRTEPAEPRAVDAAPGTILGTGADGVRVACAPGVLRLVTVRPEGRGDQAATEWARGARIQAGDRLNLEKEAHA